MKKLLLLMCLPLLFQGCIETDDDCDSPFEDDFDASELFSISLSKSIRLIEFDSPQKAVSSSSLFLNENEEKEYSVGFRFSKEHDLGMNSQPVLDQGQYGTCVTFATTSALNAVLPMKGDLVSQQCTLEFLNGQGSNLWNGAYTPMQIFDPLYGAGIVTNLGCPREYPMPRCKMKKERFQRLSNKRLSEEMKHHRLKYHDANDLNKLRAAIDDGKRVLIGFLVDTHDQSGVRGYNVKVDEVQYQGGLWACLQKGQTHDHCHSVQSGHEVIVVGYDNDLELLKIRNSWSEVVGQKGEYFMTYKYFEKMVLDMSEVW